MPAIARAGRRPAKAVQVTLEAALLAGIVMFRGPELFSALTRNAARTLFYSAVWHETQTADDRQSALTLASTLLRAGVGNTGLGDTDALGECAMIPASLLADQYLREGDADVAWRLMAQAGAAEPSPTVQTALTVPAWSSLDQDSNIVLDWASPRWDFRADSGPADVQISESDESLMLSSDNAQGKRDRVIYQWTGPLSLVYWHTLVVQAKIAEGTFLTVETHGNAGTARHLSYVEGNEAWQEFEILLDNQELRWIYISITEPSADVASPDYAVNLRPLTFLLDESVGTCSP